MAAYTNEFNAGEKDTNAFGDELISLLLVGATSIPGLSADGKHFTYDFDGQTFSFDSDSGFTAPWQGTITGITAVSSETTGSITSGISIDAQTLRTAILDGDADSLNALLWGGNDTLTGSASDDMLRGYAGNDRIDGGTGNDTLLGDAGNDRIVGGLGLDHIYGGAGNDRLFGGAGDDVIVAGSGNDIVVGGAGRDLVYGGSGADTFAFFALSHLVSARSAQVDEILDFSHAQGDRIDLSWIDADYLTDGNQAFTFVDGTTGTPADSAAGTLTVHATQKADLFYVTLDVNGGGADRAFYVQTIDGKLVADDFVL